MDFLKTAGIICLLVWVGLPILTYLFYWYEVANDRRFKEMTGTSPKVSLLCGLCTSVLFLPLVVLTYPLGVGKKLWIRKAKKKEIANVVLIHGLFHNPAAWLMFLFFLPQKGFNCFAVAYSSRRGTFYDIANSLASYLEDKINKDLPIIFIGHSLGGILSGLIATTYCNKGKNVRGVIALGAPFSGSKLTAFTPWGLAKSLSYENSLLKNGVTEMSNPPFKGIQLWSPADNMVLPISSIYSVPQGWHSERVCSLCHISMLFWPGVIKKVYKTLIDLF